MSKWNTAKVATMKIAFNTVTPDNTRQHPTTPTLTSAVGGVAGREFRRRLHGFLSGRPGFDGRLRQLLLSQKHGPPQQRGQRLLFVLHVPQTQRRVAVRGGEERETSNRDRDHKGGECASLLNAVVIILPHILPHTPTHPPPHSLELKK